MALIMVGLFNVIQPALIIALTVPFAVVGMTVARLVTGAPFGFVALLGAMGLAGTMIKDAIVCEVNVQSAAGEIAIQFGFRSSTVSLTARIPCCGYKQSVASFRCCLMSSGVGLAVTRMAGLASEPYLR